MEYGIFSDEGLLEAGFFSRKEADTALEEFYALDDAHVGEVCHDHPNHERETCEPCARGKGAAS